MLAGVEAVIFDIGSTLKKPYAWEWFEDARPALERLQKTHRLLVGANQPGVILGYMEATGMAQFFHHVYLSESVGYLKPDPQFFLHILGQEGLKPQSVAMVGDDLEYDIAPSNDLGIRSIWLRRGHGFQLAQERALEGKIVPSYTISSLDELV
jgi:putative hydrolase of the HAD superfamily